MKKWLLLASLCCLFVITGFAQEIKTVQDVLKANLEATGGMENWRKISSIETRASSLVTPGNTKQEFHTIKKFPGYIYERIFMDDPRMQIETVMRGTPEKLVQTSKRNAIVDTKDLARYESYLTASPELNMLEDKEYKLGELEDETLGDGTECWVFEVVYLTSKTSKRYYNKKTNLLSAFTTTSNLGPILNRVEEFKKEAGLLFPSKISFKIGGVNAEMVRSIDSILINPKVDDAIFNSN